jgi:adenine-specific DNA-methyltransferase
MRYFGSKTSTLPALLRFLKTRVPSGTVCDPFGGIATVSSAFKAAGYEIYTGDVMRFAHFFQIARIEYCRLPQFRRIRKTVGLQNACDLERQLNELRPVNVSSWFVNEYAVQRRFFSVRNAAMIEAVRQQIRRWYARGLLSDRERAFLIASLIDSADKVANTAGTYYAYLKKWHRKARKTFRFSLLAPVRGVPGRSFWCDAAELARTREYDILYLDPPYNERAYGGYYHLPETIATVDRRCRVHGKSGIPLQFKRSAFNCGSEAANALRGLIASAKFRLLMFHYCDTGLISRREIVKILHEFGRFRSFVVTGIGYTTSSRRREFRHRVYVLENV